MHVSPKKFIYIRSTLLEQTPSAFKNLYSLTHALRIFKSGNQMGQVEFGSDGSGQFDFLEEIRSGQVGFGSDHISLTF
jgi:hypothetical protein